VFVYYEIVAIVRQLILHPRVTCSVGQSQLAFIYILYVAIVMLRDATTVNACAMVQPCVPQDTQNYYYFEIHGN